MKTITVLVEITVDEEYIKEKYPNYRFNWNSPEEFMEYLTENLQTPLENDEGLPFSHLETFGYKLEVLSREKAKIMDLKEI